MAEFNPSSTIGTLPVVAAGYLKTVLVQLPNMGGFMPILADSASWADNKQWQFTNYALTPPTGPKQKTIHSIGTREVRVTFSGQLTRNSFDLTVLLDPSYRGVPIPQILIQQGGRDVWLFQNVYWSNISLQGQPGGNINFSFEGRSTTPPVQAVPRIQVLVPTPIPSWYSGATYLTNWSINHSVSMSPQWLNNANEYPAYYRPGPSEYSLVFTTAFAVEQYNTIKVAVNQFTMIEALVQERSYELGSGRTDPPRYNVTLTNCRFYRETIGSVQPYQGTLLIGDQEDKLPYKSPTNKNTTIDTRHWLLNAYQNAVDYYYTGQSWPDFVPDGVENLTLF